ncbi:helix-turn-helix transcriptional regulator [Bradyrhizobium cenepequi]
MTAARYEAETDDVARDKPQQMLTEQQVLTLIPIARATLYRMMKEGRFPKGTFVSPNRRLWLASEVAHWQREVDAYVPNRRRGKGPGRRHSASSG